MKITAIRSSECVKLRSQSGSVLSQRRVRKMSAMVFRRNVKEHVGVGVGVKIDGKII